MTPSADLPCLTADDVSTFHRDGYLAPLTACSASEMDRFRDHFTELLADASSHRPDHNRHLDDAIVWEACQLPAVVGALRSVLGPDLLIWRSNFFNKEPGGVEVPWHQDRNFWPLEPEDVLTAWIAIDPADRGNSCVQVVPGTHRRVFDHVEAGPDKWLGAEAEITDDVRNAAVDIELAPGQFFLFNERTLHHSEPNRSARRRMGLSIRVIPPRVKVLRYDSPRHHVLQLHGGDPLQLNRMGQAPAPTTETAA